MQTLLEARHVSVSIQRSPQDVYAFASNIENLPRWATGLGSTIRKVGGDWIAQGPMGPVKVRFTAPNELGVLDHDVVLPSGETIHNPMRVVPNGTGSQVTFTLFRQPDVPQEQLQRDADWVEKDLRALKAILEG